MTNNQNTDYSYDVQKVYLEMFLSDGKHLFAANIYLTLKTLTNDLETPQDSSQST